MTPEQELTPPPRRRRDDAVTWTAIAKWGGSAVGIIGAVWVAASTYKDATDRISALEQWRSVIQQQREGDAKDLAGIRSAVIDLGQKIDLFICSTNKDACAAALRVGKGPLP